MAITFITYRDFEISYDPPPIPARNCDWSYSHKDFDGPEDNRYGHAPSLEAAKAAIDDWWDDHFDCRCSASDPGACMALVCKWRRP